MTRCKMCKRMLGVILVVLLTLGSALADTDKEILFLGIPWDLQLSDYLERLEEKGLDNPISSDFVMDGYKRTTMFGNEDYSPVCKVAGYDVILITIDHVDRLVDDTFNRNVSENIVHKVTYSLYYKEQDEIIVDLIEKLSFLYGDYTTHTYLMPDDIYAWEWKGAENTSVELSPGPMLRIIYSDNSIEEYFQRIEEINHKKEIEALDFTGL